MKNDRDFEKILSGYKTTTCLEIRKNEHICAIRIWYVMTRQGFLGFLLDFTFFRDCFKLVIRCHDALNRVQCEITCTFLLEKKAYFINEIINERLSYAKFSRVYFYLKILLLMQSQEWQIIIQGFIYVYTVLISIFVLWCDA